MKLAEARKQLGLTPIEVASKLKIRETIYINYERYENKPNVLRAIEIAKALGKPVDELFRPEYYKDYKD